MTEQSNQQTPTRTTPGDPKAASYGEPKPPAPCDSPTPPEVPQVPETPPCPPKEECPKPKPCPEPPTQPPDPCDDKASAPADSGAAGAEPKGDSPAQHLAALRKELEAGQKKLQELEPLKSSVADIEQRILAFEKTVDDQSTLESTYKQFYKDSQTQFAELECSIPTLRCQIEISDKSKECVDNAIALVDGKVAKAKADRDAQKKAVEARDEVARRTARDLEWTKKWHDFLKKGLQEQIVKQRELLKTLKTKLTPKTEPCEAWFYVRELKRLTKSAYDDPEACWTDAIGLATYIECWPWDNFKMAWNRALVAYNKADAADKLAKTQLDQAKKLLVELEKLLADAQAKRQEWILKEIKAADCCGPKSNCP